MDEADDSCSRAPWVIVTRDGHFVDASSEPLRDLEGWLTPEAINAFWTCFELDWAGAADVGLETLDGAVVEPVAQTEERGWRLVFVDRTLATRLREAERHDQQLHGLADFAGGVARELVDPMSVVQAKIELMLDLGIADPAAMRRHLEIALQHAERVSSVLDNLRRISQPWTLESERGPVAAIVEEVMELLGAPIRPKVELRIESGLTATGPRPIMVRVVASLVRASLQRRGHVRLAAGTRRGRPILTVGPTFDPRGRVVPLPPSLTSHRPLVVFLGASLAVYSDGEEEWIELALPPSAPRRLTRGSGVVSLLALGRPAFHLEVEQRLGPHGFLCRKGADRRDALALLAAGQLDMVLSEVDLAGPGPRGHALAHDLARRFPDVDFFVAISEDSRPPDVGPVRFVRWPLDARELVRAARQAE